MNELLWSPKDERIASSNLFKFYTYIEEKFNTSFNSDYELLWEWSIQHKDDFWPSLIEFLKIDFSGDIMLLWWCFYKALWFSLEEWSVVIGFCLFNQG